MSIEIKLPASDEDFEEHGYKYDWDVDVNGEPYDVYNMDGFAHALYGEYGIYDLWACPKDEKPTMENTYEYSGWRGPRWGIVAKETNYKKLKWDEKQIEKSCSITITRNDEEFYSFGCRDLAYGLTKAQTLLVKIQEHPVAFASRDFVEQDLIGRKIWYRETPCVITRYIPGQCCVIAELDESRLTEKYDIRGFIFEDSGKPYVKLDILMDGQIWWFEDRL